MLDTIILQCTSCGVVNHWHATALWPKTKCPRCKNAIAIQLNPNGLYQVTGPKQYGDFRTTRDHMVTIKQGGGCCD